MPVDCDKDFKARKGDFVRVLHTMKEPAEPGWEIIMTKWAALEWTAEAVKNHEEPLKKELPAWFLQQAKDLNEYLDVSDELCIASDSGIGSLYELSDEGVFGGLWDMAEFSSCGLKVKLSDIPIRQETVEIANILDENPYQLPSKGSVLMAVKNGEAVCEKLCEKGVEAFLIGRFTDSKDRLIIGSEGVRYLEPSTRENFT